ncbi:MAG: phosphohistidine phosphatase SixA [Myxococcales bacterium]
MKAYLIRHGTAADTAPDGSDHARALTPEGIADLRAEAAGLQRLKVRFDLVLASPLVRARQTAEVLAAELDGKPRIVISAALSTAGSPDAVTAELRDLGLSKSKPEHSRVALVGHEPGMGELAASWLGARAAIPFKKGAICRIDFQHAVAAAAGELRWFLTPKMLILLGRS